MVTTIAERSLGLGEWAISADPNEVLVCLGLGSCVALAVYDPGIPLAGMAHMVLPESGVGRVSTLAPAKFVDLAVPLVVEAMIAAGAARSRLQVHLAGGASMLEQMGRTNTMNIGERNAAAAVAAVEAEHLRVRSRSLGGTSGRTVRLVVATGELEISTAGARSN